MIAPVRLEDWNRLNSTFSAISGSASKTFPRRWETFRSVCTARSSRRACSRCGEWHPRSGAASRRRSTACGPARASAPLWRSRLDRPRRTVARRPHRKRVGADRGSDAPLLPLSRSGRGRLVPLAGGRALRPVASEHLVHGGGRPAPGVTLEQVWADLRPCRPGSRSDSRLDRKIGVELRPLEQDLVGGIGRALWLLFGAVSVLLIACTNIAALFVARGVTAAPRSLLRLSLGRLAPRSPDSCWPRRSCSRSGAGLSGCWSPARHGRVPRPRDRAAAGRRGGGGRPDPAHCSLSTLGVALVSGLVPRSGNAGGRRPGFG